MRTRFTVRSPFLRRSCRLSAWLAMVAGVALLVASAPAQEAQARLRVDITQGHTQPMPIAITDPIGSGGTGMGADIMRVVAADLERSGLFRPVPKEAHIERLQPGQVVPRFADWRQINAQALVTSTFEPRGNGMIGITFRLWDTAGEQQVAGKEFNTLESNWRRMAHLIADEIYKRLTGEDGYFDSRVVYVAESGPATKRVKRLAIMDQDGENHRFLTDGSTLVLTPRFSPNSQEIMYMSYGGGVPRVYLRDLQTGREQGLGSFAGMSFAPRFSSDGNRAIMSVARDGNTDIYEIDVRTRAQRRITTDPAIDTSPSYSPDGRKIVFNSDRGGSPQLYVMDASGGNVKRISFGEGNYNTPVWSPRGDWIAFTKSRRGRFYIGIMREDGSGERLLTESFMDEGPSWSPNGRVIMFSRQFPSRGGQASRARLYSVDITGYNLREVLTPMDASDPAWSPLLPM